jgi:glycine dehydrogenase subunit 1
LNLAAGVSEYSIIDYFRARAAENANGYASFLGAGVYRALSAGPCRYRWFRAASFLTSYTPYQAEIAQGTLTTIFEFPDHDLPA